MPTNVMSKILNVSVNLSKIPKESIIVGKKGKYANFSLFINDETNKFGQNVSVAMNQSVEERDEPRIYVGNGKVTWDSNGDMPEENKEQEERKSKNKKKKISSKKKTVNKKEVEEVDEDEAEEENEEEEDDLPF